MNKQELTIVVILFAGLLAWGFFNRPAPRAADEAPEAGMTAAAATNATLQALAPAPAAPAPVAPPVVATNTAAPVTAPAIPRQPEALHVLSNDVARVTVSSWGGAITAAQLSEYQATLDDDSGPVVLDLGARPALSLSGIPGLTTNADFVLSYDAASSSLVARAEAAGLALERRLALGRDYRLQVTDTFRNTTDAALALPEHAVAVGPMEPVATRATTRGVTYLGLDTLADQGGEPVQRWGKKLPTFFGASSGGCSRGNVAAEGMPPDAHHPLTRPMSWAAAKNKFFVQILAPEKPAAGCVLHAVRDVEASQFTLQYISADLVFAGDTLEPGGSVTRTMSYYVGPKKFAVLSQLGLRQDEVMLHAWKHFGWFRGLCKLLLWTLNAIYGVTQNYGVAVILLTFIVRILFWPVTHKSTESMKRMQQVQPLVQEVREKYKSNPQRMNQEVMALYKEHKINPMAGCLPMFVQMPVFIALFNVLRSAVELRYAGFLWVADLSEPEGLLAGSVPLIGSLNILPLLMAATMVWQQRLTPSGGDQQQQKMMMWFMPVFMLFILYNMASGLVLYWTVSQSLSIVQMLWQRRRSAAKEAVA